MGLGCFVDVDGLVGRGRFETCPYRVLRKGRGCVARERAVREPPLRRAPFALRKGRGSMVRGLGTGLGKGAVYGFWVPACAGMTWVCGSEDGWLPPLSFGHFPRRAGATLLLFGPDSR